jgi:two-component system nitrate/nitrite response regulator NarL
MSTLSTIRIHITDPQPLFRYGLKRLLDDTEHLRVVGESSDTSRVVHEVRQCQADLLIINPGIRGNGLHALKELDGPPKPVRCIVVTNGNQTYPELASREVRVAGVLPRDSPGSMFVNCIEKVIGHQRSLEAGAADAVNVSPPEVKTPYGLTPRESQIVRAVAGCASNKHIAAQLSIAEDTVKHHLSNIFNKVGVDSRLELAVFALYHGIAPWT